MRKLKNKNINNIYKEIFKQRKNEIYITFIIISKYI